MREVDAIDAAEANPPQDMEAEEAELLAPSLPQLPLSLQPPPIPPTLEEYAQLLIEEGTLSVSDWETYKALKVTKHRYKQRLAISAPTWAMRYPKRTLAHFIDDLADPKTRARARRDFASLTGGGNRPFFQDASILRKHALPERRNPINDGTGRVKAGEALTLADWFQPDLLSVYALTSDYSIGGDGTGVALVHFDQAHHRYVLDFSLQIKAPAGQRIKYAPFRQLARDLRARGFRICAVGFDQYQSNDTYNELEEEGFACEVVKYADSLQGCNTLHDLISANRLVYGECDAFFIGEAEELQVINERKIDHLSSGGVYNSKDVWDAVVNGIFLCSKYAREQQGEALQLEDLSTYPADFDFAAVDEAACQGLSQEERIRRQLPHNGHALLAYVALRYHATQDPDTVVIAIGAVSIEDKTCKLLDVRRLKQVPRQLIHTLVGIQQEYEGLPFFQTRRGQAVEFFVPDLPFLDAVKQIANEEAPRLELTKADVSLSEPVRLAALQSLARDGKLRLPANFNTEHPRIRWAVNQLVAYPFVPKAYGILALEGLVRMALEAEFVIPTAQSRVFQLPYGDL